MWIVCGFDYFKKKLDFLMRFQCFTFNLKFAFLLMRLIVQIVLDECLITLIIHDQIKLLLKHIR